ncbi:MAG: LuxR C-terminal-related transcriptional regulator [Gammaproteobacteria bacterium]|nr:LuxR C-terminal-related transcriptional regulator [Gammaproteobacteria bacterium]
MLTVAPWLLSAKVEVPARVDSYFSRPRLSRWSELADSRVVVMQAPGGFGKTTVLAEILRQARDRGTLAAWLTLDEDDTEEGLGTYLAYAFERAGLPISDPSAVIEHGLGLVAASIEAHSKPCLLVLDEAERMTPTAVAAINFLLRNIPDNLHIAIGMRDNPGLDLAVFTLGEQGAVLTPEQLRFTKPEIIDFFGGELSRRELAEVTARTEGWPVALRLYRNTRADETAPQTARGWPMREPAGDDEVAANWLGARLLRDVPDPEREFLFDISLFDWIDVALVDEVLGREDSGRSVHRLSSLRGLVQPMGNNGGTLRLHPLLRDYCAAQLQRDDPYRYRSLHRKVAIAMEGHGHLIPAMRHASAAADPGLVGDILERAGGLRLWMQEGMTRLGAAERFLTPEVMESHPRIALLRCRILTKNARLAEARQLFERVRAQTHDFTRDPGADSNYELGVDAVVIKATLAGYGCMPITAELVRDVEASLGLVRREQDPDPTTLANHNLLLFVAYYQAARFDLARAFAAEARTRYALCNSHHGDFHVTLQSGLLAMAQGHVADAERSYERAAQIAREHFPRDASLPLILNVLSMELDLERNRTDELESRLSEIPIPLRDIAVLLDVHAAAVDVAAECILEMGSADEALQLVEESWDFALNEGLMSARRHLSALRVGYLASGGQVDRAARVWRSAGLPDDTDELLDLETQSWREMEAISCARIGLLAALGSFEAAREVASGLCELAQERGLTRTHMRSLASWMALEYQAGHENDAAGRLLDYLHAYAATDYVRPLVREREIARSVLEALLDSALEAQVREIANAVLEHLGSEVAQAPRAQQYTAREIEVLQGLARGERDKEIARDLGITAHGVRYHLKNLFRKLGVSDRLGAVRTALSSGLIGGRTNETGSGSC